MIIFCFSLKVPKVTFINPPERTNEINLRNNKHDLLRNNEHVYDKNQQTRLRSRQESSYVTTSRIVVRDHLERQCTCLPQECPQVQAGVVTESDLTLT